MYQRLTMTTRKRPLNNLLAFVATIIGCFAVTIIMLTNRRIQLPNESKSSSVNVIQLSYGDLPGYTGWARPEHTLAGHFSLPATAAVVTTAGQYWNLTLTCTNVQCLSGGALWDVRAYGPAILPGRVEDLHNGTYHVTVFFTDPGRYFLEVVLAFSNVPNIQAFPVTQDPFYEGYMVPGFPLEIRVDPPVSMHHRNKSTLCQASEIQTTDPIAFGRWRVTGRNIDSTSTNHRNQSISLDGYRTGINSLGIRTEYQPLQCQLLNAMEIRDFITKKKKHFVFIGDSNMQRQFQLFHNVHHIIGTDQATFITMKGGVTQYMHEAIEQLKSLQNRSLPELFDYYILFNSGLHDIAQLCSQKWAKKREAFIHERNFSCIQRYQQDLTRVTRELKRFPSKSIVFQTSTAGWLKWGNFGFAWPPDQGQPFPLDSHAVSSFNRVAVGVMEQENVPTYDSYWLTVSRPDHREVTASNAIGGHLVHAGPDIYDLLIRMWFTLVLGQESA